MIPLVALGQYRHVAASMDPFLAGTQFYAAAIMDLKQEPEAVRYSASNMKTILFNLHPRPQVLVTGAAVPSDVTKESIEVWNDYVRQTGTQDTLVINMLEDRPPQGDWMSLILTRLGERYGTGVKA